MRCCGRLQRGHPAAVGCKSGEARQRGRAALAATACISAARFAAAAVWSISIVFHF